MTAQYPARPALLLLALAAACGGGSTEPNPNPNPTPLPTPSVACTSTPITQLAPGAHVVIDPATTNGCLRVPAAGGAGAQYLVALVSTSPTRTPSGVQGPYLLRSSSPGVSASATPVAQPSGAAPALSAEGLFSSRLRVATGFDAMLRNRERELLSDPAYRRPPLTAPSVTAAPPTVGDVRSFKVCSTLTCSATVTVQATAKFVGTHAAIFIDNAAPTSDPLQPPDFAELGAAFDTYHYPIDTTAFGRESDVDGNGVVMVLMTPSVNNLTPDCTNGRIIGYFFGGDLLNGPNSNLGEVFHTLVPFPATDKCTVVSRRAAVDNLKPTLIHEFQHMISFNQHALIRGGTSESTWLNEALSHFAEELGGRQIPNSECTPTFTSCRSQYTSSDIINAYDYLKGSESHFLIIPSASPGTLEERGAGWLFLRWALDQFASDAPLATSATRALVATNLVSVENLTAVLGGSFSTMVPEWLMSAYLDDDPSFVDTSGRVQFTSWGLRSIWTDPRNASIFTVGFPIAPDGLGATYSRAGTLKGGSGRLFLITQAASGAAIDVRVLATTAGGALDPALAGRFGITRIH